MLIVLFAVLGAIAFFIYKHIKNENLKKQYFIQNYDFPKMLKKTIIHRYGAKETEIILENLRLFFLNICINKNTNAITVSCHKTDFALKLFVIVSLEVNTPFDTL